MKNHKRLGENPPKQRLKLGKKPIWLPRQLLFADGQRTEKNQAILIWNDDVPIKMEEIKGKSVVPWLVDWLLVGFYGISTFVGYSVPNPFLCK